MFLYQFPSWLWYFTSILIFFFKNVFSFSQWAHRFGHYYTNSFEFVWIIFVVFLILKTLFQMLELLKFKTQMCLGCKCMSKSFLNWIEFLWFYIMLFVHLSNVTKFMIAIIFCYVIWYCIDFKKIINWLRLGQIYNKLNIDIFCALINYE